MDLQTLIMMTTWVNIRICVPFTFLIIAVCYTVRWEHVPVTYYMNLLACNLIQIIALTVILVNPVKQWKNSLYLVYFHTYICASMGSLCFRMIIALERYFFISLPQLLWIRQAKGFVMICVPVWLFFIFVIPVFLKSFQYLFVIFFPLSPVVLFSYCLSETLKSPSASTKVTVDEKHRIVGNLFLFLVHYTVTDLPTVIYFIYTNENPLTMIEIVFNFSLLSFLLDLAHAFVFCLRPITCFCCCRKKNTTLNIEADLQSDHGTDN